MKKGVLREACIENVSLLREYIDAGADRIELCDNLAAGGTTASFGVLEYAHTFCRYRKRELAAIIRARGGDFIYRDFEKNIMISDAKTAATLGIDRLVIGALNTDFAPDVSYLGEWIAAARRIKPEIGLTFHMAFDHIGKEEKDENRALQKRIESIAVLAGLGIDTVLVHGSDRKNPVLDNVHCLRAYVQEAKKYGICIMAGGGVHHQNVEALLACVPGLQAVHGSKIVELTE